MVVFVVVLAPLMINDYDFFNFMSCIIYFVFSICSLSISQLLTLTLSLVRLSSIKIYGSPWLEEMMIQRDERIG